MFKYSSILSFYILHWKSNCNSIFYLVAIHFYFSFRYSFHYLIFFTKNLSTTHYFVSNRSIYTHLSMFGFHLHSCKWSSSICLFCYIQPFPLESRSRSESEVRSAEKQIRSLLIVSVKRTIVELSRS